MFKTLKIKDDSFFLRNLKCEEAFLKRLTVNNEYTCILKFRLLKMYVIHFESVGMTQVTSIQKKKEKDGGN